MRKLLRLAPAIILFILTLEISARVDDFIKYRAPLFEAYTASRLRQRDEDRIRCNIPNARFEKYQNNSAGFRGPEISIEKPEGTRRIVCMGASETYGLYEGPQGDWPSQLRDVMPDSCKTEIINSATVGLGLHNYNRYLDNTS